MSTETKKDKPATDAADQVDVIVMRPVELTGEYHADCNLLRTRISELEWALKDAKLFSELVEVWGRTDCELYKHELKASADLSLSRIDKVIGV